MPKLKRWLIARKNVPVIPHEIIEELNRLGANIGSSDTAIHQIINVNPTNREQVIELLTRNGFTIDEPEEKE